MGKAGILLPDGACETILVDTREQTPWEFEGVYFHGEMRTFPTRRATLKSGDYTLEGLESFAAIERKSLADFLSSITRGRDRFKREMERLADFRSKAIIVEQPLDDAFNAREFGSLVNPDSIAGTIASWGARYGIQFLFCRNRASAQFVALHFLNQAKRLFEEENNNE